MQVGLFSHHLLPTELTQKRRGGWQKTRGTHTGEMVSEIHVVEQQERSEE